MNKDKIIIDIRHLNIFDALKMITLKSCEQFALNSDIKINWLVSNMEVARLFRPLSLGNCMFTCAQSKEMSA